MTPRPMASHAEAESIWNRLVAIADADVRRAREQRVREEVDAGDGRPARRQQHRAEVRTPVRWNSQGWPKFAS